MLQVDGTCFGNLLSWIIWETSTRYEWWRNRGPRTVVAKLAHEPNSYVHADWTHPPMTLSWIGMHDISARTLIANWQMNTTRSASAYESTAAFRRVGSSVGMLSAVWLVDPVNSASTLLHSTGLTGWCRLSAVHTVRGRVQDELDCAVPWLRLVLEFELSVVPKELPASQHCSD